MSWFPRRGRGRPPHPDVLTPAEWRVLEGVREGRTNAEIADALGVSVNTVRTHVSSMLAKLDLPDRAALARWRGEPAPASSRALDRFGLAALWLRMTGLAAAVAVAGVALWIALDGGREGTEARTTGGQTAATAAVTATATEEVAPTPGSLVASLVRAPEPAFNRIFAAGTSLESGEPLLCGGSRWPSGRLLQACEVFHLQTESWRRIADLPVARQGLSATVLLDGSVLVVGGMESRATEAGITSVPRASSYRYDANLDAWAEGPSLAQPRNGHRAVRLSDGRTVVIGGVGAGEPNSVEVFDSIATSVRTVVGDVPIASDVEVLPDDRLLLMTVDGLILIDSASWGLEVINDHVGRGAQAQLLADGKVLITGGWDTEGVEHAEAWLFDPDSAAVVPLAPMHRPRRSHTMTLLADGSVLVAGGFHMTRDGEADWTVESWDATSRTFHPLLESTSFRWGHLAYAMADGRALLVGVTTEYFVPAAWPPPTAR